MPSSKLTFLPWVLDAMKGVPFALAFYIGAFRFFLGLGSGRIAVIVDVALFHCCCLLLMVLNRVRVDGLSLFDQRDFRKGSLDGALSPINFWPTLRVFVN